MIQAVWLQLLQLDGLLVRSDLHLISELLLGGVASFVAVSWLSCEI